MKGKQLNWTYYYEDFLSPRDMRTYLRLRTHHIIKHLTKKHYAQEIQERLSEASQRLIEALKNASR